MNFRSSVLSCAALALALTLSTAAHATNSDGNIVRSAQMRLAGLGYYVGRYDGEMGPLTETAIMNFQRDNGLAINGQLTPDTYNQLSHNEYAVTHKGYYTVAYDPYYARYDNRELISASPIYWDDRWHYIHNQDLSTRYGNLTLSENDYGSLRNYAVTFNGQTILVAKDQPAVLRVSDTFRLSGEDAVIFTAYQADGVCSYQSYLLTIHSDGSFNPPRKFGDCGGSYEAHVADLDNALMISFPNDHVARGWTTWDTWRYKNNALVRL